MAGGNRKIGGSTGNAPFPDETTGRGSWSREEQYRFKLRGKWPVFPVSNIALEPGDYFFVASSGVVSTSGSIFLPAQGGTGQRVTHENLYNTIGTHFGNGDGVNSYGLPDVSDAFGYLKSDITVPSGVVSSGVLPLHRHQYSYSVKSPPSDGFGIRFNEPPETWNTSYDGSYNNGRFKEATCCISNAQFDYPVGSVVQFMLPITASDVASLLPSNVVVASGQELSRVTYADLYEALGTNYGVGDGASTFNIPDYRGIFIRGLQGKHDRVHPSGFIAGSGYADASVHKHRHQVTGSRYSNSSPSTFNGEDPWQAYPEMYPPATTSSNIGIPDGRPKNLTCLTCLVVSVFSEA